MDSNDRVGVDDGLKLASHRIGVAVSRSIQALKTIEDFLESRRKLVIRSIARRPESVTANSGEMVKMKVSDSRGLRFVSQTNRPGLVIVNFQKIVKLTRCATFGWQRGFCSRGHDRWT